MFLYGLYTIESHHQHKQPQTAPSNHCDSRKQSGFGAALLEAKNVGRQKSYSIGDSCHLKALHQHASNSNRSRDANATPPSWPMQRLERRLKQTSICESINMTKYELNLCKFEYYLEKLRKLEEQSRLESFLSHRSCLPADKRRNTVHSAAAAAAAAAQAKAFSSRAVVVGAGNLATVKSSSPTSSTSSASSSSSSSSNNIEKDRLPPRSSIDTQQHYHYHYRSSNAHSQPPVVFALAPRKATFPRIEAFRNNQQEKCFRSFDAGADPANGNKRACNKSSTKKWIATIMGKIKGGHQHHHSNDAT